GATIGLLVSYIVAYVIPMENVPVDSSVFFISVLVFYFVPQFAFAPLWIKLSTYTGKKNLWAASMWISALVFVGYFFALNSYIMIWLLTFILGTSGGIGAVVAPAISADIIDYDEYLTGERKEGTYYAVWNMVRKGAASLTAIITGFVLQWVGFEPNVEQTETTKIVFRSLFALMPAGGYMIGALVFTRFSFNEKEHSDVRRVLATRTKT
ncbi:MAG: MFS transporter, partial [Pseudomonadales bacterium]|nr:MFS transporter [Pseudomonadales bacterium]